MWIHEPKLISTLGEGSWWEPKEKSTLKSEWDKIVNKTDNKLFDVMANFIWTDSSIKMDIQFLKWENTKDKQVLKFLLQSQLLVGETEQKSKDNILSIS